MTSEARTPKVETPDSPLVSENVSLAIVDAVAEPVGEPGLESSSRYLASIANVPLIWHVFDELAEGGVERATIIAHAHVRRELEQVALVTEAEPRVLSGHPLALARAPG